MADRDLAHRSAIPVIAASQARLVAIEGNPSNICVKTLIVVASSGILCRAVEEREYVSE